MSADMSLLDRTAYVGGSTRGLGHAVARALLCRGARVCINGRDAAKIAERVRELQQEYGEARVTGFPGDQGGAGFADSLMNHFRQVWSTGPDVVVTNTGGPRPGSLLELKPADWKGAFNALVVSAVSLMTGILPGMIERRFGRIIHLTSMVAKEPDPMMVLSAAMRSALIVASKAASREMARHGITINTILTGAFRTERFEQVLAERVRRTSTEREELLRGITAGIPAGNIAEPAELGECVAFLCSREAQYLNGVAIPLDGGASRGVY